MATIMLCVVLRGFEVDYTDSLPVILCGCNKGEETSVHMFCLAVYPDIRMSIPVSFKYPGTRLSALVPVCLFVESPSAFSTFCVFNFFFRLVLLCSSFRLSISL